MKALAGKQAAVIGPARVHAAGLAATLAEAGANVATVDVPDSLDDLHILVVCPLALTARPSGSVGDALADVAHLARLTTDAATAMKARGGGVIVHVTGLAGLGGWPGWDAAGAAFAAVHGLVASNAVRFAADRVRINALVAGVTAELAEAIAAERGTSLEAVRARIPNGRFVDAADLGIALLYLVHDSAGYVTGETLTVDGGWDVWGRLHAAVPA